jgi:hypothetical protein
LCAVYEQKKIGFAAREVDQEPGQIFIGVGQDAVRMQ